MVCQTAAHSLRSMRWLWFGCCYGQAFVYVEAITADNKLRRQRVALLKPRNAFRYNGIV